MFAAHQEIYDRDGEHDDKQQHGRGRCIGRISAAVAVEHVIDIADDGVHTRRIEVYAKDGNCVTVRLKGTYEAGDHKVEDHG